jgi:hypothetical protein
MPGRAYLGAVGTVSAAAALVIALLPVGGRTEAWTALAASLAIQAPLGWWLVRSVGTPRFLSVWGMGMLARLGLVGVMGLMVVPLTGMRAEPVLIPLVALLIAFVMLEGVVLMIQHSRVEIR